MNSDTIRFIFPRKVLYIIICLSLWVLPLGAEPLKALSISDTHGLITQHFSSSSGPTIVVIEDNHSSLEVQKNLIPIIHDVFEQCFDPDSEKILFIEGAIGAYTLDELREFPFATEKERIIFERLKNGILLGAEAAQVLSQEHFTLYGLEDPALFWHAYREFYMIGREHTTVYDECNQIEQQIRTLKQRYYNQRLSKFDSAALKYEEGRISFGHYVPILYDQLERLQIDYTEFLTLLQLRNTLVMQNQIHFPSINREIEMLAKELIEPFSQETEYYKQYRAGEIEQKDIATLLYSQALKKGISLDNYLNLPKAVTYWRSMGRIDESKRDQEIMRANNRIRHKLAATETEKAIISADTELRAIQRLLLFTPFRPLVEEFVADPARYSLEKIMTTITSYDLQAEQKDLRSTLLLEKAHLFYSAILEREKQMTETILEKVTEADLPYMVLLVGKEHVPALVDQFRKQDVAYMVVKPKGWHKAYDVRYMDRMLGYKAEVIWPEAYRPADFFNASLRLINQEFYTHAIERMLKDMEISLLLNEKRKVISPPELKTKMNRYMDELRSRGADPAIIDEYIFLEQVLVAVAERIKNGDLFAVDPINARRGLEALVSTHPSPTIRLDNKVIGKTIEAEQALARYFLHLKTDYAQMSKDGIDMSAVRRDFSLISTALKTKPVLLLHQEISSDEQERIRSLADALGLTVVLFETDKDLDKDRNYFYIGIEPIEKEIRPLESITVPAKVFLGMREDRRTRYIKYIDILLLALSKASHDPLADFADPEEYFL